MGCILSTSLDFLKMQCHFYSMYICIIDIFDYCLFTEPIFGSFYCFPPNFFKRKHTSLILQVTVCKLTSGGLLIVFLCTSPLHLHDTSLDATVGDVTESLGVPLHTLSYGVRDGGSEAALTLLKLLVVSDLTVPAESKT